MMTSPLIVYPVSQVNVAAVLVLEVDTVYEPPDGLPRLLHKAEIDK